MSLRISMTSDFVCPWCLVGEQRLGIALARLPSPADVQITWRPFELNPGMPAEGMDRRAYRVAKFGGWERGQALDARLTAMAAQDGLTMNFERITRTPSTLPAHRLMWLAARERADTNKLARGLLEAYFCQGRDISQPDVLADLAASVGLAEGRVGAFLRSDEGLAEVRAQLTAARREDIEGVPFYRIGDIPLSGAQSPDVFEFALRRAAAKIAAAA